MMIADRKGQVSMEFLLIFTLALTIFAIFLALMSSKLGEIADERDRLLMVDLAEAIKKEVILAGQVQDNYLRRFELPQNLNGKNYSINMSSDGLDIFLLEGDRVGKSYFSPFPYPVKGGFAYPINQDTLKHCITKNAWDGTRISMNQMSLEFGEVEDLPAHPGVFKPVTKDMIDAEGRLKLMRNQEFTVYLRLNCVDNIRSIRAIIDIENETANLLETDVALKEIHTFYRNPLPSCVSQGLGGISFVREKAPNTFFNQCFLEQKMNTRLNSHPTLGPDSSRNRHQISIITLDCEGIPGNIFMMKLKTPNKSGKFKIRFDPAFSDSHDSSVMVVDCATGTETSSILPSSKIDAFFVIV